MCSWHKQLLHVIRVGPQWDTDQHIVLDTSVVLYGRYSNQYVGEEDGGFANYIR